MTEIYFVRHAESTYDEHNDSLRELSPKGMSDRAAVTRFLSERAVDAVLSSPYIRAVDTLRDYAESFGFNIRIINDFRERRVGNVWIDDFDDFCRRQWLDFDFRLDGGESLNEVRRRNISALKRVLSEYKNKSIVIGTHGTALSTIISVFEPDFGYDDFVEIKPLMPFVVHMTFDGSRFVSMKKINLFAMKG